MNNELLSTKEKSNQTSTNDETIPSDAK
ncbi:unnamed protein product, partial [Rotaria magnacalcarata]